MKKVLFIANSDRHIRLCHIPYIKMFKDNNYIVHVATNSSDKIKYSNKKINLHLKRNPYSIFNIFALFKVRKLCRDEQYTIISCHTPIGGFLGRVATIGLKNKPKVFYTAHGFHFYKGANFINWLIYYPIEKVLSKITTAIITMNEEDYTIAKNKFYCDVYKINGIGMNKKKLLVKNNNLKEEMKLNNKFIVSYVAEISKRKNQFKFLDIVNKHEDDDIIYLMIGDSNIKNVENKFLKYKNVKYIKFKEYIGDYINMSDLIISPSTQEGLPQNILEALYFKKYVIATNIRGSREIINNNNGRLVNNMEELYTEIIKYKNTKVKKEVSTNLNKYSIEVVLKNVFKIYNKYLDKEYIIKYK